MSISERLRVLSREKSTVRQMKVFDDIYSNPAYFRLKEAGIIEMVQDFNSYQKTIHVVSGRYRDQGRVARNELGGVEVVIFSTRSSSGGGRGAPSTDASGVESSYSEHSTVFSAVAPENSDEVILKVIESVSHSAYHLKREVYAEQFSRDQWEDSDGLEQKVAEKLHELMGESSNIAIIFNAFFGRSE